MSSLTYTLPEALRPHRLAMEDFFEFGLDCLPSEDGVVLVEEDVELTLRLWNAVTTSVEPTSRSWLKLTEAAKRCGVTTPPEVLRLHLIFGLVYVFIWCDVPWDYGLASLFRHLNICYANATKPTPIVVATSSMQQAFIAYVIEHNSTFLSVLFGDGVSPQPRLSLKRRSPDDASQRPSEDATTTAAATLPSSPPQRDDA